MKKRLLNNHLFERMLPIPMKFFQEFKWAVPHAFNSAIASCRFEQGDILYDTPLAYSGSWGEALQHINYSLQVKFPPRSSSPDTSNNDGSVFSANWSARVVFEFQDHKTKTSKLVETTQGNLYTLLWKGNVDNYLTEQTCAPKQAIELLDKLELASVFFEQKAATDHNIKGFFILPFCPASDQLVEKYKRLDNVFLEFFQFSKLQINLTEISVYSYADFVPTAKIVAFFFLQNLDSAEIKEAIKKALYKPSRDKKTKKENFSVSNHGLLKIFNQ